ATTCIQVPSSTGHCAAQYQRKGRTRSAGGGNRLAAAAVAVAAWAAPGSGTASMARSSQGLAPPPRRSATAVRAPRPGEGGHNPGSPGQPLDTKRATDVAVAVGADAEAAA